MVCEQSNSSGPLVDTAAKSVAKDARNQSESGADGDEPVSGSVYRELPRRIIILGTSNSYQNWQLEFGTNRRAPALTLPHFLTQTCARKHSAPCGPFLPPPITILLRHTSHNWPARKSKDSRFGSSTVAKAPIFFQGYNERWASAVAFSTRGLASSDSNCVITFLA